MHLSITLLALSVGNISKATGKTKSELDSCEKWLLGYRFCGGERFEDDC